MHSTVTVIVLAAAVILLSFMLGAVALAVVVRRLQRRQRWQIDADVVSHHYDGETRSELVGWARPADREK